MSESSANSGSDSAATPAQANASRGTDGAAGTAQGHMGGNAPIVVSALYTAGMFLLPFLANVAGLIWAYVARGSAVGWERSVLTYQIRTFWISVLYSMIVVAISFATLGFGYFLLLPLLVWYLVRIVKMWIGSTRREAISSELSWLW